MLNQEQSFNQSNSLPVQGNALNSIFTKILSVLLIILPFSLFYSYFSESHSQSVIFYFSLAIQAIISACMGFAYFVSLILAKQNYDHYKKEKSNNLLKIFVYSLEDIYRSILPVSIKGKENKYYTISFLSYLSSAFILSFEISIMAFSFFAIALSQLHLLLNSIIIKKFFCK